MASLYVDRRGISLRFSDDALVFHENGKRIGTVPVAPLERIYLRGDVTLNSSALGHLGAKGIGVIVLSGRRAVPTLMLPRAHNDARIRFAQYRIAQDGVKTLDLARATVHAKITAQLNMLRQAEKTRLDLRKILKSTTETLDKMLGHVSAKPDIPALRGVEGAAAARYFEAYAAILPKEAGFSGRNRRPPKDPVNACLSLSYTLLHAEAVLAAHGAGFDPYVGFLHDLDFSRESLACDLVEPLRAVMDRFVWQLFAKQHLRARHFSKEKDGACLLGKAGREIFYARIEDPMEKIRRELDGTLRILRQYVLTAAGYKTSEGEKETTV